jgi:alpha-ketoglutarate-dependent taurine dioxygenase
MELRVHQLHPLFVGEVSGIDAGLPLAAAAVRAVSDAIDRYAVLVLHDQELDDERQLSFARHFGEIEAPGPRQSGGCGPRCRISRISTRTTGCAPPMTPAVSISSATVSGIPTARFAESPQPCRCFMLTRCRRAAEKPNLPICEPPGMLWP